MRQCHDKEVDELYNKVELLYWGVIVSVGQKTTLHIIDTDTL